MPGNCFPWVNEVDCVEVCAAIGWTEEGPLTNGSATEFGHGVSVSGNGLVMAVGDTKFEHESSRIGRIYLYDRVGGAWVVRTSYADLPAVITGYVPAPEFGHDTALSYDGSVLAVGTYYEPHTVGDGEVEGTVYVFEWGGSSWSLREKIIESDLDAAGQDYPVFGWAVDLSDDGTILVVAASEYNGTTYNNMGAIWTYDWNTSTYVDRGRLDPPNQDDYGFFGRGVAINAAGDVLVVKDDYSDMFVTYDDVANSWVRRTETEVAVDADSEDVQLNADGDRLAVGNSGTSERVDFYDWVASTGWVLDVGTTINKPDAGGTSWGFRFGASRALTTLAVGGTTNEEVWTYVYG